MKSNPTTPATNVTDPSKTNAHSKCTHGIFTNPFKPIQIDWLSVWIILMLCAGAVLAVMALKLMTNP